MNTEEYRKWLNETCDTPLEAMAAFFDDRIQSYEAHMSRWKAHYARMAELLPENSAVLLDIGCGSGLELDCIFARFPELRVTGIDLSAQMLAKLREKHGNRHLELIREDYFCYELQENAFDVAVSFETLHHYPAAKKRRLFASIRRALKSGGTYLECDYIATSEELERMAFAECARRRKEEKIPDGQYVHFDTPLTIEHEMQAMKEAGFSKVECLGTLLDDEDTAFFRATK